MIDKPKRVSYRKLAFATYKPICAYCGFSIHAILEVAHIDGNRVNNEPDNLVILCPTHHKMLDLDIIGNDTIRVMRERMQAPPINHKEAHEGCGRQGRAETRLSCAPHEGGANPGPKAGGQAHVTGAPTDLATASKIRASSRIGETQSDAVIEVVRGLPGATSAACCSTGMTC